MLHFTGELEAICYTRGIAVYQLIGNCHSTSGVSSHASGISLSGTVASDNVDQHSSLPMHRFQIVEQLSITVCQGMIVNLWSFRVANYSYGTSGIEGFKIDCQNNLVKSLFSLSWI